MKKKKEKVKKKKRLKNLITGCASYLEPKSCDEKWRILFFVGSLFSRIFVRLLHRSVTRYITHPSFVKRKTSIHPFILVKNKIGWFVKKSIPHLLSNVFFLFLANPLLSTNFSIFRLHMNTERQFDPIQCCLPQLDEIHFLVTDVFSCNQLTRSEYINGFGCLNYTIHFVNMLSNV